MKNVFSAIYKSNYASLGSSQIFFVASFVVSVFSFLIYFPSITFSVLAAEIFPWAIIYYLIFYRKVYYWSLLIVGLMLISVLFFYFFDAYFDFYQSFRSIFAYLNPLLLFSCFLYEKEKEIERHFYIIRSVFVFFVILGLGQLFDILGMLQPIFDFIMPRGGTAAIGGGRGVSLMSSEPARASFEIVFLYLVVRYFFVDNKFVLLTDIIVGLFLLFVVKAGTGVIIYFIFLFLFHGFGKLPLMLLIIYLTFELFVGYFVGNEIRAIKLIDALISASTSWGDFFENLIKMSGFRGISIYSSFKYGVLFPFGAGIGSWQHSSVDALAISGFSPKDIPFFVYANNADWKSIRPTSYVSSLMLDVGVIGVGVFFSVILGKISQYWMNGYYSKRIIVLFVLYLFFWGSIGDPIPWIAVALILRHNDIKKSKS